jgi:hypothetical protein
LFDPQKALSYHAVFTRIVDEPASVPGLLQNAAAQVARIRALLRAWTIEPSCARERR